VNETAQADPKPKNEKKKQQQHEATVFDYELIRAAQGKIICEFDLGGSRISAIPVSVDKHMVKVRTEAGHETWLGKQYFVTCSIPLPPKVENVQREP
jgi:hypothetical protein